jgi:hypothetical protein
LPCIFDGFDGNCCETGFITTNPAQRWRAKLRKVSVVVREIDDDEGFSAPIRTIRNL